MPIDRAAYERYHALPIDGPNAALRAQIVGAIQPAPTPADGSEPKPFATMRMNERNECPLFTADRLCGIQKAVGEKYLSHACDIYPRLVHTKGLDEMALSLSCPEAARLVLTSPDLLAANSATAPENQTSNDAAPLPRHYWEIRTAVLNLIRNRAYPLWQRMFLLSIFCRRLDAITDQSDSILQSFLSDFESTVTSGNLRAAMDQLSANREEAQADRDAQLDIVLRLAGMMLHKSNVRPRFQQAISWFTAGIGNGPGSTLQSLAAHYARADAQYFEPYTRHNPAVLENYLINTIFRCQFPWGKEGMTVDSAQETQAPRATGNSLSREFLKLAAQFVLMRGLLIGAAGAEREGFSAAQVVLVVQAASKHFEHHPDFLNMAHDLLVETHMNDTRGIAILLRNPGESSVVTRRDQAEAFAPSPQWLRST